MAFSVTPVGSLDLNNKEIRSACFINDNEAVIGTIQGGLWYSSDLDSNVVTQVAGTGSDFVYRVAKDSNYIFTFSYAGGTKLVSRDLSDLDTVIDTEIISPDEDIYGLETKNGYIYAVSKDKLRIYSHVNGVMTLENTITIASSVFSKSFRIFGNFLYFLNNDEIRVYSIAVDPISPVLKAEDGGSSPTIYATHNLLDCAVSGNYLYTSAGNSNIYIRDITTILNDTTNTFPVVNTVASDAGSGWLGVTANFLILAQSQGSGQSKTLLLEKFDITDPFGIPASEEINVGETGSCTVGVSQITYFSILNSRFFMGRHICTFGEDRFKTFNFFTVPLPPTIEIQPQSQTQDTNQNVTFSVQVSGTAPFSYRWKKNGVLIGGSGGDNLGNTNSYSINNISLADAANYTVVVTNSEAEVTSNIATLTVNAVPPTINVHPQSQSANVGETATFTVTASGNSLSYQWKKNGVNVGNNSTFYTTPALLIGDNNAVYTVVVTNFGGSVTSNDAVLTVIPNESAPVITTQPSSQVSVVGQTATFSVTASGSNLSYQWKKNGSNVGTNSAFYTTPTLTLGDNNAVYTVVVSNSGGSVTSDDAVLTVNAAGPTITTQPQDQTAQEEASAIFTVAGSGTGTITYQWRKDNVDISGETSSTLTIDPVSPSDAATYSVEVSDDNGSVVSSSAVLTVTLIAPTILVNPVSISRNVGTSATFTVTADTGSSPLSYQWKKNGSNIGTNSNSFTIPSVVLGDDADYSVVVSNAAGSVTSATAHLTVTINAPVITVHPSPINTTVGATGQSFSVTATGTGLTYQWRKAGVNIGGATSSSYALGTITNDMIGEYTVAVTNAGGTVISNPANLSINITVPGTGSGNVTYSFPTGPQGTDTVTIPKSAVSGPTVISITESTNTTDPLTSPNFAFMGRTYDLEPNGLQFINGKSATLTFFYTNAELAALQAQTGIFTEASPPIYITYFDTDLQQWVNLPTTVSASLNRARATVTHFTQFALASVIVTHVGGDIYVDLSASTDGNGTAEEPFTAHQLENYLFLAGYLDSDLTIYMTGEWAFPSGVSLNFTTPNLNSGFDPNNTITFKRKGTCFPCAKIFANSLQYDTRGLIQIGGGIFKTTFADIEVLVTGSLNNILEGIIEVTGTNEVIVANDGLVANHLSNFALGSGSSGSCCGGCCESTGPIFLPVLSNGNTKIYSNTWVTHATDPEVLNHPTMGKFTSFVDNQVILGNVAYTYYLPTTPVTKAEGNFFHEVSGTISSVIDIYETSVLTPELLVDEGDFDHADPLVNVLGNTLTTLDLTYGPSGTDHGLANIPDMVQLDDNYPDFSAYGNVDAGYSCEEFLNTPPSITSTAPSGTIFENVLFTYTPTASDFENNIVSWDLVTAPDGMTINVLTGEINWTPDTGVTTSGLVTIVVTDTCGLTGTQTFTLTVIPNTAPVITSVAPGGLICGGVAFTFTPTAIDGENNITMWSLINAPTGMTINPTTGQISWTPGVGVTTSGLVTIKVEDEKGLFDTQDFTLTVNSAPTITSTAPVGPIVETVLFTYAPTASDVDGNLLSSPWSLTSFPVGMTINSTSGLISWTPGVGVTTSGLVTVKVEDGCGKFATQSFTLAVIGASNPPEITSTPLVDTCDCEQFVYEPTAINGTGTLVWSLINPPVGMIINPSTGRVTWTPGLCPDGHSVGGHSQGGTSHGGHSGHSDDGHSPGGTSYGHSDGDSNGDSNDGHSDGGHSDGGHSHDLCCGGLFTSGLVTIKVTDSIGEFDTQDFTVNICQCINFIPDNDGDSHGDSNDGHSNGHSNDSHDSHGHKLRSNKTPSGSYIQLTGNVYDVPAKFMVCEEPLNSHGNTVFQFLNKTFHITSTGPSILNKPLKLVIKYTDAELVAMGVLPEDRLKGFVWNVSTNSWSYLKTKVNLDKNNVEIYINQLVGADYNLAKAAPIETQIDDIALYQPSTESLNVQVEFDAKDIDMDDIELSYKWKLTSAPDSSFVDAKISPPLNRISGTDNWISYSIIWNAKNENIFINSTTSQSVIFRIIANDGDGTTTISNSSPFTIILNTKPKITSNPKNSVNVGDVYNYQPVATDKENNITHWQASGLPSFLTINTGTGMISGTATIAYVGTYSVTIKVFDSQGAMDIQTFNLNVKKKKN